MINRVIKNNRIVHQKKSVKWPLTPSNDNLSYIQNNNEVSSIEETNNHILLHFLVPNGAQIPNLNRGTTLWQYLGRTYSNSLVEELKEIINKEIMDKFEMVDNISSEVIQIPNGYRIKIKYRLQKTSEGGTIDLDGSLSFDIII